MYGLKMADGDIAVRGDGNVTEISGRERIEQELSHWLLEPVGTDTIYGGFGSTLQDCVGNPMLDEYISDVRSEVLRVLGNYIEYQNRMIKRDRERDVSTYLRNWPDEDIVVSVSRIDVTAVADTLKVRIELTTAAGTTIYVNKNL